MQISQRHRNWIIRVNIIFWQREIITIIITYIERESEFVLKYKYVHISRTATFAHLKNSTFGIRWWQNWVKAQSNMKNETWIERAKRILFTRTHIWSTEMIEILAGLWTLLVLGVVVQTQERSLQSTLLTWKIYTITLLT